MKLEYNGCLYESVAIPQIWYHGSKVKFSKFEDKFALTEDSNAQLGPGFYLSLSKDKAIGYAYPNGFLNEVKLTRRTNIKGAKTKYSPGFLNAFTRGLPDELEVLSNWDEDPIRAKRLMRESLMENNATLLELVQSLWFDCYKGHEDILLSRLRVHQIDGFMVYVGNGVTDLICYNPDILKILKTLPYSEAKVEEPNQ